MGLCAWYLVCAPVSRAADDGTAPPKFHEFTSTDGKSFKGQIQSMVDDVVIIKREDGQIFKVKPEIFTSADQTFIEAWMAQQTLARKNDAFSVTLSSEKTKANNGTFTGYTTSDWTEGYSVKLKSQLPFTWKNLSVRYILFKVSTQPSVQNDPGVTTSDVMGEIRVSELKSRTETSFSTGKAAMSQTALVPGYVWNSGGPRIAADRLRGLWVRIYDADDELIFEWSSVVDLSKKYAWDSIWVSPNRGRGGRLGSSPFQPLRGRGSN